MDKADRCDGQQFWLNFKRDIVLFSEMIISWGEWTSPPPKKEERIIIKEEISLETQNNNRLHN